MMKYILPVLCFICMAACDPYKVPMVPSYQRIPVIKVEQNDTLYSLAKKYDTSVKELARQNNISKPEDLQAGQKLSLPKSTPNKTVTLSAETVAPTVLDTVPQKGTTKLNRPFVATGKINFTWPAKGKIISEYGVQSNGIKNDGVNIAAKAGTAIKASESGVVVYAGNELKGYGNLVLIRHEQDYMTTYAHADSLTVQTGDVIEKGGHIGYVGTTGNIKTPQLHFEIRHKTKSVDPKRYLH